MLPEPFYIQNHLLWPHLVNGRGDYIEWASALVPPTPLSRGGGQADRCRIWSINSSTANTDKHDNVKPPDHQNCQIRAIPFFDSWS